MLLLNCFRITLLCKDFVVSAAVL